MVNYVIPGGGLCNRLRVIQSALALNPKPTKTVVLWRVNSELGAPFGQLFEQPSQDEFTVRNLPPSHPLYWLLHPRLLPAYKWFSKRFGNPRPVLLPVDLHLPLSDDTQRLLARPGGALLHSFYTFATVTTMDGFIPVPAIRHSVNQLRSQFDSFTVGIHIRRTDNVEAIKNSPIELFIDHMNELLRLDSRTRFFLATDDASTKQLLSEAFPGKVMTRAIAYARHNQAAVMDAVVDLHLLGSCRRLLCSHYSSFSDTAALIGYQPKQVTVVRNVVSPTPTPSLA